MSNNEWNDDDDQPQAVPQPGTVEYWSYVLKEQRRASQLQRQEELYRRVNYRQELVRVPPAIEQRLANLRMQD